jgi:predicted transcriptional regulator
MAGRPQIDPKKKQAATETVVVRLTPAQAEKLRRLAAKKDTSVSSVVREAVEKVSA